MAFRLHCTVRWPRTVVKMDRRWLCPCPSPHRCLFRTSLVTPNFRFDSRPRWFPTQTLSRARVSSTLRDHTSLLLPPFSLVLPPYLSFCVFLSPSLFTPHHGTGKPYSGWSHLSPRWPGIGITGSDSGDRIGIFPFLLCAFWVREKGQSSLLLPLSFQRDWAPGNPPRGRREGREISVPLSTPAVPGDPARGHFGGECVMARAEILLFRLKSDICVLSRA